MRDLRTGKGVNPSYIKKNRMMPSPRDSYREKKMEEGEMVTLLLMGGRFRGKPMYKKEGKVGARLPKYGLRSA